ncbi:MAG: calcium-binding protein, partial [Pseudomonadota bacterium]
DLVNAGTGADQAFGGDGSDVLNLEQGNDIGVGGRGADVINAGTGDDLVYGDERSILDGGEATSASSMAQHAEKGSWTVSDTDGKQQMSQTVSTEPGDTYTVSFEVAANLSGGAASGAVEVLWDGAVVGMVEVDSGVYETHSFDIPAGGADGELTFREVVGAGNGPEIITDAPIAYYEKSMDVGGQDIDVSAFAPGQAKLYQMISGQLNVFDPTTQSYETVGDPTGLGINAIGFNVEDDMIYGLAKATGIDALGNSVSKTDLVMVDAEGNAYRIGETPVGDYVGDFDDSGNLWTFDSSANRVTKIDVDNLDADGNPAATNYDLPNDLFGGRAYDVAYNAEHDCFFAVESPGSNGGTGAVHKIDISGVEAGEVPSITSIPINGTLYDEGMVNGMAKGAYGAVFMDGDGNLYYGLNKGV